MMPGKISVQQMKLAAGWLAGAGKLAGVPIAPSVIEFALKSIDTVGGLRRGDALAQAIDRVRRDVEASTRAALAGEFGTDWESRSDLAATLAALPDALDRYALGSDDIFAENLDPVRIAARMADAAEAARDELFRSDTPGATLLREVATQAYAIAYRDKDFVLGLAVRGQREVLDRQDRHEAKLDAILAAVHQREAVPLPTLQRILAGFGETEVAADPASIETRLAAKAEEYRSLRDRLDHRGVDDAGVATLRREARALIDAGISAAPIRCWRERKRRTSRRRTSWTRRRAGGGSAPLPAGRRGATQRGCASTTGPRSNITPPPRPKLKRWIAAWHGATACRRRARCAIGAVSSAMSG